MSNTLLVAGDLVVNETVTDFMELIFKWWETEHKKSLYIVYQMVMQAMEKNQIG